MATGADSDEEEVTTLRSEFQSSKGEATAPESSKMDTEAPVGKDQDETAPKPKKKKKG
eukprot:CAMPEP_0183315696 /NCGR_PEP_ID=MMETSP0160_2-20130417/52590_1 /TAXON_ID=2839 ORGANISM="Odontella Sinensis, Strain Grunow 1884" /NCGR_SAMPLE_ID=MMETSP0160_2 /ASSEMBLY_ACC=CAM_ASM_000250 /LENGTH=57 /DNA_ID=CAMNT_0025481321 /DNA_START=15 /DNA_END=185 /DNA_ORIENTATION=-